MNPHISWIGNAGNTYSLYKSAMTWVEANTFAISIGGYLAKVDSTAENTEIYQKVSSVWSNDDSNTSYALDGGESSYLWLGGSDASTEGIWRWSRDNSLLSTSREEWGSGGGITEPDNFNGIQDYLAMAMESWPWIELNVGFVIGSPGQWNDINGENKLYFVVERDPSSLDTTPPALLSASPEETSTSVSTESNIVFTFDEAIELGDGEITIRQDSATGQVIEVFNSETDSQITISGSTLTINPTQELSPSTRYFLVLPSGVVRDLSGNIFAGVDSYEFTTSSSDGSVPQVAVIDLQVERFKKFDEGEAVVFDVVRSGNIAETTSVSWALTNNGWGRSATPTDFQSGALPALPSGRVVFNPGETRKTVSVEIFDDAKAEGEEWLGIELLGSGQFSFGGAGNASNVTIRDNDEVPNNSLDLAIQKTAESLVIEEGIDYPGDIDFYRFNLLAGQSYLFSTLSYQPDELYGLDDPDVLALDVRVYDQQGVLIDVPRPNGLLAPGVEFSRLVFEPKESAFYYVSVSADTHSGAQTGGYDLLLTNLGTDDFAHGVQTHGRLVADSRQDLSAAIHFPEDVDSFWVYLDPTLGPQDLLLDAYGTLDLHVDIEKPDGSKLDVTRVQAMDSIAAFSQYRLTPDIAGDYLISIRSREGSSSTTGHYLAYIEAPGDSPQRYPSTFSVSQRVAYIEEPFSGQSEYLFTVHREGLSNVAGSVRVDVKPLASGAYNWDSAGPSDFSLGAESYPSFLVNFEPGEAEKIIAIPIVSDTQGEGEEYFVVAISEPKHNGVESALRVSGAEAFGRIVDQNIASGYQLSGRIYHWKTGALLSGVEVGGADVLSGSDGAYVIDGLSTGSYAVSASKVVGAGETDGVITSADALAALKIAVGRNPNGDGTPVSPYQFISADVNEDGKVSSADALAILKMAVKRLDAPAREWIFVDEMKDFWNEGSGGVSATFSTTRSAVPKPEDLAIVVDPALRSEINLVAMLKGDVNGSWVRTTAGESLPLSYFQSLAAENPSLLNLAQFG